MKNEQLSVLLGIAVSILAVPECPGTVDFQLRLSGTSDASASIGSGGLLSLDVVAVSIFPEGDVLGNLDAFTYRIAFPDEAFTLDNNEFAAPFDNVPAPGGFNGSVPWVGLPLGITFNADAGSPGATPLVADLYRTTATQPFNPGVGSDLLLERLVLRVPSLAPGDLPADYAITLNVLEAVDQVGTFHVANSGSPFLLTVVPEPEEIAAFATLGLLAFVAVRRRARRGHPS